MNTNTPLSVKTCTLLVFFLVFSFSAIAQSTITYKVVCDKTDNSIKIIESSNHSAKYVPLKGGFPFRQIAEKWITENHPSRTCAKNEEPPQKTEQTTTTTNDNTNLSSSVTHDPQPSGSPSIDYRNSSVIFHGKFSNLGEAFFLNNESVNGIELGFEQLFGTKGYFGTGLTANFFFADMDNWQGVDNETIYFFRIPVFGGYRIQKRMFVAMFEAGGALNSGFKSTENDLEAYGLNPENISINFMARAKVGFPGVMLELGYDSWLGDVFADEDFSMSAFRIGVRVSF